MTMIAQIQRGEMEKQFGANHATARTTRAFFESTVVQM